MRNMVWDILEVRFFLKKLIVFFWMLGKLVGSIKLIIIGIGLENYEFK